jgi:hypothetical protein
MNQETANKLITKIDELISMVKELNNPIRAYVVERDITSSQNQSQILERRAGIDNEIRSNENGSLFYKVEIVLDPSTVDRIQLSERNYHDYFRPQLCTKDYVSVITDYLNNPEVLKLMFEHYYKSRNEKRYK